METIEGFVTKCSKYRDNDAIINLINDNGEDSIIIRGAYSKNSKYLKYAKNFYYGKFEIYKANYAHKKLKDVQVLKDYNLLFNDYKYFPYLEIIKEFFTKIYIKDDANVLLKLLITTFDRIEKTKMYIEYTTLFLGYCLKISGYGINTNLYCAKCSTSKLTMCFSIAQGTFVCANCASKEDYILNADEVKILTSIFDLKYVKAEENISLKNIDYIKLICIFADMYSYYSDNKIISIELIKVHL